MRYVFHPEARREYLEAIEFYNTRQPGLGVIYTQEIEAVVKRILEAPLSWRLLQEDVRRCLARKFPYAVLYTIESDSILILAVMHCSRKPAYWRERL